MKAKKLNFIGQDYAAGNHEKKTGIFNSAINYYNAKSTTDKNSQMNRKRAYWLSQLIGWGSFTLGNILMISLIDHFDWRRAVILIYAGFTGICFTHIYRAVIKKYNWLNLQLKKIILRIILSSVATGTVIYVFVAGADIAAKIDALSKFESVLPLAGIIQISVLIFLWVLIYFAVHFFENYKRAEIESYIWEAAVKDYELKTLKSQLNPHFMFNALNSIRALIDIDPENAKFAVTKLSNILRYSLKMERIETVSLQEEMQTVSDYLSLETIRFEERLKYTVDIDSKSSNIEIPPMMIQTLVENGIKHGISKQTEGGCISIKTAVNGTHLHIFIKNTGHIDNKALMNSSGFGINNTKHRLHLLYGEHASFNIKNNSDNEVLAEIIIPAGGIKNESFNS